MKKNSYLVPLFACLIGCANVSPQDDFNDVSHHIAHKTGEQLIWKDSAKNKERINTITHQYLQGPLSLNKAVRIGLLNNPKLQEEYEKLGMSAADLFTASRMTNPTFAAGILTPVNKVADGNEGSAELVVNFTDLLRLPVRKRMADDARKINMLELTNSIYETINAIKKSYYDYLLYSELSGLQSRVISLQKDYLRLLKEHFEAGITEDVEYLQGSLELNNMKIERQEFLQHKNEAQLHLLFNLGIDVTKTHIIPSDKLQPPRYINKNPNVIWKRIQHNNPALRAACFQIERASENSKLAKLNIFGDVNIGAVFDRGDANDRRMGPIIDFELPLFHQRQGEISRANYELNEAKKALTTKENAVKLALYSHLNSIKQGERILDIYSRDNAKVLKKISETYKRLREKQKASQTEMLLQTRQSLELKRKYYQMMHELWLKRFEVEALGISL